MGVENITIELTAEERSVLCYELDELIVAKRNGLQHAVRPDYERVEIEALERVMDKLERSKQVKC
jgi:hypothetical protein